MMLSTVLASLSQAWPRHAGYDSQAVCRLQDGICEYKSCQTHLQPHQEPSHYHGMEHLHLFFPCCAGKKTMCLLKSNFRLKSKLLRCTPSYANKGRDTSFPYNSYWKRDKFMVFTGYVGEVQLVLSHSARMRLSFQHDSCAPGLHRTHTFQWERVRYLYFFFCFINQ